MPDEKIYGVYVNPFPESFLPAPRLKSEARHAGLAWWIRAADADEAWETLLAECPDPAGADWLRGRFVSGLVLIAPMTDVELRLYAGETL